MDRFFLIALTALIVSASWMAADTPANAQQTTQEPECARLWLCAMQKPRPKGNPNAWITYEDYPKGYTQNGRVGFRLIVNEKGRVGACTVTQSSGVAEFDRLACELLPKRARFYPALNMGAKPDVGEWSSYVSFCAPSKDAIFAC